MEAKGTSDSQAAPESTAGDAKEARREEARKEYVRGLKVEVEGIIYDDQVRLRSVRKKKDVVFVAELLVIAIVVSVVALGVYLLVVAGPASGGLTAGLGLLVSAAYFALDRAKKSADADEVRISARLERRAHHNEVAQLAEIVKNKQNRENIILELAAATTSIMSREEESSAKNLDDAHEKGLDMGPGDDQSGLTGSSE